MTVRDWNEKSFSPEKRKERAMEKLITNFGDLKKIRKEIDAEVDHYVLEGHIKVFPEKEYDIHNFQELDVVMDRIRLFSSPYASMTGTLKYDRGKQSEY